MSKNVLELWNSGNVIPQVLLAFIEKTVEILTFLLGFGVSLMGNHIKSD